MRRFLIFLMSFVLMFSLSSISFASGDSGGAVGAIQSAGERIVSAIIWCGYAISMLMLIFIGIKYILGSADSKANMKSAVSGYLIGAAIVFSVTTIMTIVVNLIPSSSHSAGDIATSLVDKAFEIGE